MTTTLLDTIKKIFWIGLLFAGAAVIISAVEQKRGQEATDLIIDIENLPDGHALIQQGDVLLSIERSFGHMLIGVPVGGINVERIERVLESDPFVSNADVYIDALDQVHIGIQQREPVIRVIDKNGINYYLDAAGEKMPMSEHFTARVIIASGEIPPFVPDFQDREQHVVKDLFQLTKRILSDDFLEPMIEQIYVNRNGEFTLTPKLGSHKIQLGTLKDLNDKLSRLEKMYTEVFPYEGWKKHKTINLKYKGQVVCERR